MRLLPVLLSLGSLQDEATRELSLPLGGSRRALTLLAPADDLARFPAGALWPSGTALARALRRLLPAKAQQSGRAAAAAAKVARE